MKTEKQLRAYIFPNVLAMIGISCYILADTYFISRAAGTDGITALNLTLPIYSLIFAVGSMTGIGAATRYGIRKALGDPAAETYFADSVIWNLLLALPFLLIGFFCPDAVLALMGADQAILAIGTPYLRIVFLCAPLFMCNYSFTAFVRNDGAPKLSMTAVLLSSLFNIVFDYVFMFPMGLGMRGAALATGLAPGVSMLVCLLHYTSARAGVKFRPGKICVKLLGQFVSLGAAAFVGEMAAGITTLAFNLILLGLSGNAGVAAYGICANAALVGTAIFNGISQGMQPMASQACGRADYEQEHRILRYTLILGMGTAVLLTAAAWIFAEGIVSVFNSENSRQLAAYAVDGIRLYFPGFLAAGVNILLAGFFSATGKGMLSFAIAVSRGIAAILFFAFVLSAFWGMTGVWLAFPAAEVFTLLGSVWLIRRKKKKGETQWVM